MIKLVLADLDSTLIWTPEHVITPFALDAVRTLQAAGVCFAPCTGRVFRFLPQMFAGDLAACSTAVAGNGQLVYLNGELIESVPIARPLLLAARDAIRNIPDAFLVVEYEDRKVAVDADLDFVLAHVDNFWNVRTAIPDVPTDLCYKANVRVTSSYERAQEVASALHEAVPELDFVCPAPGLPHIDVVPAGLGKDNGSDVLVRHLGISPSEVCCFGDAENDLAVLRHFEHSVAVANAVPEVSAVARWHIGPACEDAVAHALLDIASAASAGRMPDFMS